MLFTFQQLKTLIFGKYAWCLWSIRNITEKHTDITEKHTDITEKYTDITEYLNLSPKQILMILFHYFSLEDT
ncbi:MAG TPA: hypothetical protein VJ546_00070, partial [Bacillales bacterium]|nr:hypothetical protein [Bacillales bacterium]